MTMTLGTDTELGSDGTSSVRSARFVGHGGVRLAADIAGADGCPAVVFLHGGGQTRHAWRKAVCALADAGYRVLTLDLRGHGESEWAPEGDYSMDALCGDLRAVLATLGKPAAVVGASMGGIIALILAGEGGRRHWRGGSGGRGATAGGKGRRADQTVHAGSAGRL
jgi:pimeloyl-ACP methyl ester carboxylesterase